MVIRAKCLCILFQMCFFLSFFLNSSAFALRFRFMCVNVARIWFGTSVCLCVLVATFIAVYCFYFHFVSFILSAICYFNILFARNPAYPLTLLRVIRIRIRIRAQVQRVKCGCVRVCTLQDMFVNISKPVVVGYKRFEHPFQHPPPPIKRTLCSAPHSMDMTFTTVTPDNSADAVVV